MEMPRITWPLAASYFAALAAGTALLIAAYPGETDRDIATAAGMTRADQVMQAATERALVSGAAVLLADDAKRNQGRGG